MPVDRHVTQFLVGRRLREVMLRYNSDGAERRECDDCSALHALYHVLADSRGGLRRFVVLLLEHVIAVYTRRKQRERRDCRLCFFLYGVMMLVVVVFMCMFFFFGGGVKAKKKVNLIAPIVC